MGAYQQFVKAHYHDKQFAGMTPTQTIKGVASLWKKSKGGAMTAGAMTGGKGKKAGALTGGKGKKAGSVKGAGFLDGILGSIF